MSVYRNDESRVCAPSEEVEKAQKSQNSIPPKPVTTSPEASSTASDSPTPTNSVHEKNWSSHWQSLVSEEQRELLGTEEESSDRQSDGEVEGGVWEMTEEQREYYRAQFTLLQPDASALLPGRIARAFFEKSRLPVGELRKIWQLADVTKDGALSLDEFNTAMHLVVLRRNQIPLPETLPPALVPPSTTSPRSPASPPHRGKQWTKFVESPTSSVSSPGPKPVNFDFHKSAVEQDPKILHPVALRVTPGPDSEEPTSLTDTSPIRPIQRPQPKKHTAPGPGAIPPPPPQPPNEEAVVASKKEPPPPPPPRPHRQHARSSSLDLTRLGKSASGGLNMPPVVPPRSSPGTVSPKKQSVADKGDNPGMDFANFAQFPEENSKQTLTQGAFQVYRKPVASTMESPSEFEAPAENFFPANLPPEASVESRERHNAALRRVCRSLQSTLAALQEEKATLQTILDDLVCR